MASAPTKYTIADLSIQDKERRIIPFVLNEVQYDYLHVHLDLGADTNGCGIVGLREIILKARQFGFSTLILALYFLNTINNSNTNSVVIAHDLDSTVKLFRIVSRYYQLLPAGKPETQYSSKREIFWPGLNSRISVETAGKSTAGRGDTIHNLHMSEWAFWDDPDVLTGLLQAVPATGNVFAESTANGRDNPYHTEYQLASDKAVVTDDGRTESVFRAKFYAWWRHSEYQLQPPADFEPTGDEEQLQVKYDLLDAQTYWYRLKRREPGMGHMIAQEYPCDDDEAFKATGNLYFDDFVIDGASAHVVTPFFTPEKPPPAWYTYFAGVDPGFDDPWAVVFAMMDQKGDIHVLESDTEARLGETEQSQRIVQMAERWGVDPRKLTCVAGADLWARKHVDGVEVEPPVEKYYRAGLDVVFTGNDEVSQWQRNQITRDYIREHRLWVYAGFNTKLIAALSNAKHDPVPSRRRLPLHDKHSHPIFALGCATGTWPMKPREPSPDPLDPLSPADRALAASVATEAIRAEFLKSRNRRIGIKEPDDDDGDGEGVDLVEYYEGAFEPTVFG